MNIRITSQDRSHRHIWTVAAGDGSPELDSGTGQEDAGGFRHDKRVRSLQLPVWTEGFVSEMVMWQIVAEKPRSLLLRDDVMTHFLVCLVWSSEK